MNVFSKRRSNRVIRPLLALLMAGVFGFGVSAPTLSMAAPAPLDLKVDTSPQKPLVNLPDFTPIIKKVGDTVVNISSTSTKTISQGASNPFPPSSPFHQFFQQFMAPGGPKQQKVEDLGSGFIISPNGYIVTAAHVVRGADHIMVTLTNHQAYPAKLVGLSVRYDTALLKINAKNLPTAPIGNSDKLQVGQWLLAVGAPFGFFNTVTQGVVSAVNRTLPNDDQYIPFIQTDVPINPGNSGGPLLNMSGQVVGINDQIYTSSGGYMGLSFSIPINTVMRVVHALAEHKQIQFGWLGVEVQDVTAKMGQALHLKEPVGALVASVEPNSPAAKAGLEPGDVVVTYNDKPVYEVGQLPPMVGNTQPGTRVKIGILRNGKPMTLNVTIGTLPKNANEAGPGGSSSNQSGNVARLQIQIQPLTAKAAKNLGIKHGVLVIGVGSGPAAQAGIAPGMVIQDIGQKPVDSPAQLEKIVAGLPAGEPIPVRVRNGKQSLYTVVILPPAGS
ncbi:Do family serine endopeptidase [Acidihalobacter ferrooxydans]|uniref:Probable periplasmic serine endoprotease DegP-like n=1 Tax=Acidihalobacter ferrooxydans TaxID=1765967 RepID=A0A1P8UK75_9GAMM|nr:Do family serine endopeptidase [Acidihalobacter ferrooxydans]APZ44225.1 serine protease [Acidihalobacter ferrooxydans]